MSEKYVIKNCPAYMYDKQFNRNVCKKNLIPYETCCEECQDCTDCKLKQIVERCRKEQKYHKEWQKETGFNYATTGLRLAEEILQLLDIEECE